MANDGNDAFDDRERHARIARWRRRLSVGSAMLWLISLFLPALSMHFDTQSSQTLSGWRVLQSGWIDVAALQFGWLANLALAGVVIGLSSWGTSARWMRVGALLLLAFTLDTIDLFVRPMFYENPSVHSGYWLWASNNVLIALCSVYFSRREMLI